MSALRPSLLLLCGALALPAGAGELEVSTRAGAEVYLSQSRTLGGAGGGVGVRYGLSQVLFAHADLSYLFMVGNAASVRAGVGVRWPGKVWTPSLSLELGGMFGDGLAFLQPGQGGGSAFPVVSASAALQPLHFKLGNATVSLLSVGIGGGTDFFSFGPVLRLGLLEVSARL